MELNATTTDHSAPSAETSSSSERPPAPNVMKDDHDGSASSSTAGALTAAPVSPKAPEAPEPTTAGSLNAAPVSPKAREAPETETPPPTKKKYQPKTTNLLQPKADSSSASTSVPKKTTLDHFVFLREIGDTVYLGGDELAGRGGSLFFLKLGASTSTAARANEVSSLLQENCLKFQGHSSLDTIPCLKYKRPDDADDEPGDLLASAATVISKVITSVGPLPYAQEEGSPRCVQTGRSTSELGEITEVVTLLSCADAPVSEEVREYLADLAQVEAPTGKLYRAHCSSIKVKMAEEAAQKKSSHYWSNWGAGKKGGEGGKWA